MKKLFLNLFLIGSVLIFAGCKAKTGPRHSLGPLGVKTYYVKQKPLAIYRTEVEGPKPVLISFKVPGKIDDFPVVPNNGVVKGGRLVNLYKDKYKKNVKKAQKKLDKSKQKLLSLMDDSKELEAEKREVMSLKISLEDKNSKIAKIERKIQKLSDKISDAEGKLSDAESELAKAEQELGFAEIRAPWHCSVGECFVRDDVEVEADQNVLEIEKLMDMHMTFDLEEEDFQLLRDGKVYVEATVKYLSGQFFPIKPRDDLNKIKPVEGKYPVTFVPVDESARGLRVGRAIHLFLYSKEKYKGKSHLYIPAGAVVASPSGKPQVWIFDPKRKIIRARAVTTGRIQEKKFSIFGKSSQINIVRGIEQNEHVAVTLIDKLRHGKVARIFFNEIAYIDQPGGERFDVPYVDKKEDEIKCKVK